MTQPSSPPAVTCSFCGATRTDRGIVAGPNVFICDNCIPECRKELSRAEPGKETESSKWRREAASRCSFCDRPSTLERVVLGSAGGRICSTCVETCEDIFKDQGGSHGGAKNRVAR